MKVETITKDMPIEVLSQLKSNVKSKSDKAKTIAKINSAIEVFDTLVNYHGLKVECHSSELLSIVDEYIHFLCNKHHLAMVIQVSHGVSVYDMKYIQRIRKNYSSYCSVIPGLCDENLISFYICYYKPYEGQKFDIDLFCSLCS